MIKYIVLQTISIIISIFISHNSALAIIYEKSETCANYVFSDMIYNFISLNRHDSRCAKGNFKNFLNSFIEDAKFQCLSTKFPLKITTILPADNPSQSQIDAKLDLHIYVKYFIPIMNGETNICSPYTELLKNKDIYLSIKQDSNQNERIVYINKDSTGISINLKFIWDECWFLSEIIDYST